VILAPSFDRGIDLAGDDCRVIIIPKIPYPFLGDAQVNARLYRAGSSGRRWYVAQTIRTLCQMTGRAVRSEDDWAISYILDSAFSKLYAENKAMFPTWWRDAVVWDVNDPKWRVALEDIYSRFGEEMSDEVGNVADPLDEVAVF
jgi:Rad3-related DNA helicase